MMNQAYNPHQVPIQQQQQQPQFYQPQESLQFYQTQSQYEHQQQPPPPQMQQSPQDGNQVYVGSPFGTGAYAGEPPLLQELGVNLEHITSKTKSVVLSIGGQHRPNQHIMDDSDLAGPIVFCVLFGAMLMLANGKVQFGYIYGLGMIGCLSIWAVMNLMQPPPQQPQQPLQQIDGYKTASVLGYSLLPMVLLSAVYAVLSVLGLASQQQSSSQSVFGFFMALLAVLWCTRSAATIFHAVLCMRADQYLLVAYPLALFYSAFALLTVF